MRIVPGIVIGLVGMVAATSPVWALSQDQAAVVPHTASSSGAANQSFPKWSEFPLPPTEVPTVAEIKVKVAEQNALRDQLTSEVAAIVWDKDDPNLFYTNANSRIDPKFLQPLDASLPPTALDAYGADLRKKATPPPIVN